MIRLITMTLSYYNPTNAVEPSRYQGYMNSSLTDRWLTNTQSQFASPLTLSSNDITQAFGAQSYPTSSLAPASTLSAGSISLDRQSYQDKLAATRSDSFGVAIDSFATAQLDAMRQLRPILKSLYHVWRFCLQRGDKVEASILGRSPSLRVSPHRLLSSQT